MSSDAIGKSSDDGKNLKRGLTNRHLQLISIGGAIGTGLFMGSGRTISLAGPSIILVYAIIGFFLFFFMRAMGELLLSNLKYKSFMDVGEDLLGPWAGFFLGWSYWLCWIVTGTADVIAISDYFKFWFPNIPTWAPAIFLILLLFVLNNVSVKLFGEMEFWFASIKIVAILAMLAIGIYCVATAFTFTQNGVEYQAAISNLWAYDGFFPKGVMGFFAGFQIAFFAYVGLELVGTTAAETQDPEKTLPKAINAIPIRIVFFYVFALIAIMSITPWNTLDGAHSPFVGVFSVIGIAAAASIINFVVLTSASSSANSGIYSTSRMLYGLATVGVAPKAFAKLSANHTPGNGLRFSCACLLLGSGALIIAPSAMDAFETITTLSSILFLFVWTVILLAYLNYRHKYPERHAASKYKLPGGVISVYAVLAFFVFVLVLFAQREATLWPLIYSPIWFIILAIAYRVAIKHHEKVSFWGEDHK